MKLLGSSIYVTSTFYDFDGSLFSTLDSLLCVYILTRKISFCKMGYSIRKKVKILVN